jgi:hypothetical protein
MRVILINRRIPTAKAPLMPVAHRAALVLVTTALAGAAVWADEPPSLTLRDHAFTPAELRVPAGERLRIDVINADPTPAEFESSDLHVEKIVTGGGHISVRVGPLRPGAYEFFDDYHPDQARGRIIAEAKD